MDKPLWMWLVFFAVILVLVALDLGVLYRKHREIGVRESLKLTLWYMTMGVLFGCFVWYELGAEKGEQYFTGFIIEKSLSLDNIFVMSLIFGYFGIPRKYQHRVLFWGICGVILLRGLMIGVGAALVAEFHWVLYIFAAFLIFTGIKMLYMAIKGEEDEAPDIGNNPVLRFLKKRIRVTEEMDGEKFFIQREHPAGSGTLLVFATPLFLTLVFVEIADIIFAVDSVPAIFAITTDPYIIYTSNIFAILGLRALYFALAAILHRFEYLKYTLSLVLIFIGSKVFLADLIGEDKFPTSISLGVTFVLIAGGVIYSLYKTRNTTQP